MKKPKVAIIMGSTTDLPVMSQAREVLHDFKISTQVEIVSAHRDPEKMVAFAKSARTNGFALIIAGAVAAAHLPGMVASLTTVPVIGVPIKLGSLKGLDAWLSINQMPKGIPVATVAIDGGANAGLLAVRILGISDAKLEKKLQRFQIQQKTKVKKMNQSLRKTRSK